MSRRRIVAFDDRGAHIAISASSGLRIGNQRDEVWLVRTSDGAELFRRYASKYSRATVALPTGRYFAVDELRDSRASVRVYQLARQPVLLDLDRLPIARL